MQVPFLDLKKHHDPIRDEVLEEIGRVIDSNAFAGGSFVARFEEAFASFCGSPYAVGVGSGTEALWFALLALGVGPGDEVITVPSTFIATSEAISFCGARPVFVDIDEATYTLDPRQLERAITPRTKAIIPVQLFGQMADMDSILDIARAHNLPVIEDACQAHGAEYQGRKAGTLGIAGCYSFYPGKNLGAFGEAGAVVTSDPAIQQRIRTMRDHGQEKKYHHTVLGWNGRMDGIQGAVLHVKLKKLAESNARRQTHAAMYDRLLKDTETVTTPTAAPYGKHVYHLYVVRVKDRDTVMMEMARRGVQCGIHYPVPLHLTEAYRALGLGAGSYPVAERCAREFLSLPMFPELTGEQIAAVADALKEAVCKRPHPCATHA